METQKPRGGIPTGFLINLAVPTFALVGTIIGLKSLTTVFGMGTGVTFSVCSPEEDRRTVRRGDLNLDGCKSGAGGAGPRTARHAAVPTIRPFAGYEKHTVYAKHISESV